MMAERMVGLTAVWKVVWKVVQSVEWWDLSVHWMVGSSAGKRAVQMAGVTAVQRAGEMAGLSVDCWVELRAQKMAMRTVVKTAGWKDRMMVG